MSDHDHRDAMRLWQAICAELGERVPFPVIVLASLEMMLSELREEHERLREPDEPERTLPRHVA